jgi:hypothetical protein
MRAQGRAHTLVVGRYLEALMRNALQLGFVVSMAAAVLAVPVPPPRIQSGYTLMAIAADVLAASEDVTLHCVFHFFLRGGWF